MKQHQPVIALQAQNSRVPHFSIIIYEKLFSPLFNINYNITSLDFLYYFKRLLIIDRLRNIIVIIKVLMINQYNYLPSFMKLNHSVQNQFDFKNYQLKFHLVDVDH